MDRLKNVYHLGVKELFSLRRDIVLMALVVWAFTFSIYTAATGMSHDLNNASIAIVDEDRSAAFRAHPPGLPAALLPSPG
jgi:ABC-2 type transport system permease protein